MLIVTSNEIPGHRIDAVFGEVMGLTVRARDIGAQVLAGLRSLGGGELPEMTRALYESRQQVMARMVTEAEQRGANAILAMRFDTSELGPNWTEVCAYGTAVFAIPLAEGEAGATGQSIYLTGTGSQES
jgi:uncharacterized protein YbjQ (UPF0145 family)